MTRSCIKEQWDSFFHSRCSRRSLDIAAIIRILYGFLLLSNVWGLFVDFDEWFVHLLPVERAKTTIASPYVWAIWEWIPRIYHASALRLAMICWMVHAFCLALGCCWPTLQCCAIFWWHSQFHAHNGVLWNGEDVAFRIFSFFLVFFPLYHVSISSLICRKSVSGLSAASWPMWPFRLLQMQMCMIYLSAGLLKLSSPIWRTGDALFYVIHRKDLYGKWINPSLIFGNMDLLRLIAWATMTLELSFPFLVWFRRARTVMLISMATFHVSLHLSMNLNHFHLIMLVGCLSFLIQADVNLLKSKAV